MPFPSQMRKLTHDVTNQLQAVCGWYELGDYTAALIAIERLENLVDQMHDNIEKHAVVEQMVRAADA